MSAWRFDLERRLDCAKILLSMKIFRHDVQDKQDGANHFNPVDPVHHVHYQSNMDIVFYFLLNIFPSGHGE